MLYFKIKWFFFSIDYICFCLCALVSKISIANTPSLHISKVRTYTLVILPNLWERDWQVVGGPIFKIRKGVLGDVDDFFEFIHKQWQVKPLLWHFFILCLCPVLQIWVVTMDWLKMKRNKALWILSFFQQEIILSHRFNHSHQDKIIYYRITTRHEAGERQTRN